MSFVIIDNVSPFVLLSKYCIGSLFIFTIMSFLNLYVSFCEMFVIVNPCISENVTLVMYNASKVNKIVAIFSKFIPFPPDNLLIIPLNISVVAFPKIFGPTTINIVLPIAKINTIIRDNLYCDK